jgi:hypothetical protein
LRATLFPSLKQPAGRPVDWSWPIFLELLADPPTILQAKTKGELPLVKLGRYRGDTRAEGSPLAEISGLEGDHDAGAMQPEQAAERLRAAGILCVVVTTPSHTPQAPRWRVFAPLSTFGHPEARAGLLARLNGALGGALAPESFVLKQTYYLGRLTSDKRYTCIPVDGECVDTLPGLDATAVAGPTHTPAPAPALDDMRMMALAGARANWEHNAPELTSALKAISPDCSYEVWMKVTAAFYFVSGGHDAALAEWLEWSGKSSKFPGDDEAQQKWAHFGRMTAYNLGTLYHHAREAGWRKDEAGAAQQSTELGATKLVTVAECLEHWVWLSEAVSVAIRNREPRPLVLKWPAVMLDYSASTTLAPDTGIRKRTARLIVPEVWQQHKSRKVAVSTTFSPGMPAWCHDPRGALCLNTWEPFHREKTDLRLAQPFIDHVAYLIPDEAQRTWFLQWLAHCEQHPEVQPQHHWLMVTRMTGIGRNWLSAILDKVWPRQVALSVDLVHMLQSGFNEDISHRIMACVDELDVGGTQATRNTFSTSLKALLTAQMRNTNVKYGLKSSEFNCTRWLMFSNSETAIPLQSTDRRINVVRNPSTPREQGYYSMLYALRDNPLFVRAVGWYLRTLPIDGYDAGARAGMSDAKRLVVGVGRDEVEEGVDAFCEAWPSAIAPAEALRSYLTSETSISRDRLRYLGQILQHTQAEMLPRKLNLKGANASNESCVMLRDYDRWRDAPAAEKVSECLRGMAEWRATRFPDLKG